VTDYKDDFYNLSHRCIYGTDANPRMARTSKMNMIMHGDGHGGVHHHDGLLNINGIFQDRFDVILTNPPFGSRIDKNIKITDADKFTDETLIAKYRILYGEAYDNALNQVNNHIGKPLLNLFPVGSMSGLTEVLFIERCLDLLKPGGRMGIVLPEGVLNTSNLQKVREHFESRAKIILICSVPQDVFIAAGATVKPSLVFLKRFNEAEEKQYNRVKKEAEKEIECKNFSEELVSLKREYESEDTERRRRNEIEKRIYEIEKAIVEEAKPLIKKNFDYKITIAKVDKAGITSTGTICENELMEVEKEFSHYNNIVQLWKSQQSIISYALTDDGRVLRTINGKEQKLT
jgi:type I restriction enzyme M protein